MEAADHLEEKEATVGQGPGTTSGGTRLEPELWDRGQGGAAEAVSMLLWARAAETDVTLALVLPAHWQGNACFILQNSKSPKWKRSVPCFKLKKAPERFVLTKWKQHSHGQALSDTHKTNEKLLPTFLTFSPSDVPSHTCHKGLGTRFRLFLQKCTTPSPSPHSPNARGGWANNLESSASSPCFLTFSGEPWRFCKR